MSAGWFVVFYRLEGSGKYNLSWSDDIDYSQARDAIMDFFKNVVDCQRCPDADP